MAGQPLQDSDDATISDARKADPGKLEKNENGVCETSKGEEEGLNGVVGVEEPERTIVTLAAEDDPKQLPSAHKWLAVLTISSAALCVTCTSSIVSSLV